jgi:crotonobetainyl-CoA:carnitine CoA-transferase CaiB-like acyl-CoA transferase
MIQEINHPKLGTFKTVGAPVKFSPTLATSTRQPPPMIGEHTDEILRDFLKYSEEKVQVLREDRAIQ